MKHFPATRAPARLAGLGAHIEHTRPESYSRTTAALLGAVFYAAGFFTGAILFGEILLTLHTP